MRTICMYCVSGSESPAEPDGDTHGICSTCREVPLSVLDQVAGVHTAARAAGLTPLRSWFVVAPPQVVLSIDGIAALLGSNVELDRCSLLRASMRLVASSSSLARELAGRVAPLGVRA